MNNYPGGKHTSNVIIEISPRKRQKVVKKKAGHTLMDENKNPRFSSALEASIVVTGDDEDDCDVNEPDSYIATVNRSNQTDSAMSRNVTAMYADSDMANDTLASGGTMSSSHDPNPLQDIDIMNDHGPHEGRPILNTSLLKLAAQNQQRSARSPLTTVVCNKNAVTQTYSSGPLEMCCSTQRKLMGSCGEESFHFYQQKQPQGYFGLDNFTKLSDEMVLSVFKWLPKKALIRCCLVNRRFNNVAQDESLWGRLDMSSKQIRPGAFANILGRGVVILRLAQSKIADPIWNVSDIALDFTTNLQYLDMSMAVISKKALAELLSRCRRLKKLSLEHVALDRSICFEIAANTNLEALNLALCEGIDARSVRLMMTKLQALQSLNISWTHIKFDTLSTFVECVSPNLLRLNIAGCRRDMTDSHLTSLVRRCPNLIELDLSDCTLLTPDAIKIICKCKNLEYLSLSRCYSITVSAYLSINELMGLAYLDIFGVLSESAIQMLQTTFPSVGINKFIHSAVARPTVGSRRTSIWGLRTRD